MADSEREEEAPSAQAAGGEGEVKPSDEALGGSNPSPSSPFPLPQPQGAGGEGATVDGEPIGSEGITAEPGVPGQGEEAARPARGRAWLRELLETALLALLIFLAVRASFQNFRVEGSSMDPSLESGEYLIVNKLAYATIDLKIFDWLPFFDAGEDSVHHLFGAPGRGDVIVFQSPQRLERDFIKRIIGVPGDQVVMRDGKVFLNGEELVEPYAQGETVCSASRWCDVTVPPGYYYVLGDNRGSSTDSRTFGPVPEENIVGKTLFTYWPLRDFGLAPNHGISYATGSSSPGE